MDNKVYYGEYSLGHWIDLILRKNIVLPEYQRYFVWNESKVKTLVKTFKNKQFVPPVTIGAYKDSNGKNINLIIDGQQRITSVFLAYLGLYPDANEYKKAIEKLANDNDDISDEDLDNILEWNFNKLVEKGNKKEIILSQIKEGNYKKIDFEVDDNFLETNFLGFSYLVPHTKDEKEQQKYYSSVFRNINIQGEPLLPQESRESLYFLDKNLKNLFSPAFSKNINIEILHNATKIDFVRYLSLLSQYYNTKDINKVARGYRPKMEKLYEEYIYSAISNDESSLFGSFQDVFSENDYNQELLILKNTLTELKLPKSHPSIIDVDVYLFGLIYQIVFQKKEIVLLKKDELMGKLMDKIKEFKNDQSHTKSPNNLTHLRNRIESSIKIFEEHIKNES